MRSGTLGFGRFGLALLLVSTSACGPSTQEPRPWMVDVFSDKSGDQPRPGSFGYVRHYHLHEDLTMDVIQVGYLGEEKERCGRTWEPRSDGQLAMIPDPESCDADVHPSVSVEEWIVTRSGDCGPHEVVGILADGRTDRDGAWYRGQACTRPLECPDDAIECDPSMLYWCDVPPECEES